MPVWLNTESYQHSRLGGRMCLMDDNLTGNGLIICWRKANGIVDCIYSDRGVF